MIYRMDHITHANQIRVFTALEILSHEIFLRRNSLLRTRSSCRRAECGRSVGCWSQAWTSQDQGVLLSTTCWVLHRLDSHAFSHGRSCVEASSICLTIVACVVWWNYAAWCCCCCCRMKLVPDIALTGSRSLSWGCLGLFSSFCCIKTIIWYKYGLFPTFRNSVPGKSWVW